MVRAILFDLDDTLVHVPNRQGASNAAMTWEPITRAQVGLLSDVIGANAASNFDLFGFLESFWVELTSRHPEPDPLAPPFDEYQWQLGERLLGQMMKKHLGLSSEQLVADCWRMLFHVPPAVFGRVCFSDTIATLTTLKERGLTLCVVTNRISPSDVVTNELKALGLEDMFDAVISAGEVGFRKPHSKIFEHALVTLGARNDEAVMIGDNHLLDVEPAVRMGMVGVLKHNRRQRPAEIDPAIVHIDTLDEVLHVPGLLSTTTSHDG